MESLTRCGHNDDHEYDDRRNNSCFNEWLSFVLQRCEVWVGDPVGKPGELMYCNRGDGDIELLK
jgi:hypothetical protein